MVIGELVQIWRKVLSIRICFRYSRLVNFPNHDNCFYYILAFLSTAISVYFLELTNPTINFQVGDIKRIPIVIDSTKVNVINNNAIDNIKISNSDWDSYETSWDFKKHPMGVRWCEMNSEQIWEGKDFSFKVEAIDRKRIDLRI